MPWPPPRGRKCPQLTAEEARSRALVPYRWKPGQSGNPEGFPRSRREQMAACDEAALAVVPAAIVTLTELMQNSEDDRVKTRCAELLLERGLGRPREAPPPAAVEVGERVTVNVKFVH